ncbi:MAG: glycosyltransferase [Gammaproteobacteria bacterium]
MEIAAVAPPPRKHHDAGLHVLVLGGSQGARALNECVPRAFVELQRDQSEVDSMRRVHVWHQTGADKLDATRALYADFPHRRDLRIDAYIERMEEAYAWADVVICRAGAMTIAELSAAGVASVLVPFPYAVDDHQTANAHYLVDVDAGLLVPEEELSPARLASILREFAANPARAEQMAVKARSMGRPQATADVASLCMEVAYA